MSSFEAFLEAEQAVIGGLLLDNSKIADIDLTPLDFCDQTMGQIFGAMTQLEGSGKPFDLWTVSEELSRTTGKDWSVTVATIARNTASATNVQIYAKSVRRYRKSRDVRRIALELSDNIALDESAIDIAISELMALDETAAKTTYTLKEALKKAVDKLDRVHKSGGKITGITSGLTDLDDCLGGFQESDLCVIGARPAMGKAQPLTSKILMADGSFKTMANISIGDKIASVDGSDSYVDAIYPQGLRPIFSITLSDGRVVECDLEHIWQIESSKFKGIKLVTTSDLIKMIKKERYRNRIRISGHDGVFGEDIKREISPWLLGFLIGDGCLSRGTRFSSGEDFIIQKVTDHLPDGCRVIRGGKYDYSIVSDTLKNPITEYIRRLGLNVKSPCKFIPEEFFRSNRKTREMLLAGLIESDGWSQNCSVQFSSSSESLSLGVQRLVRSLGGSCSIREKKNVTYLCNGVRKPAMNAYICSIALANIEKIIESERVIKNISKRKKTCLPIIRDIKYIGYDHAQCIKVSHNTSLYITDGYTVTHNTGLLLGLALNCGVPAGVISAEMSAEQLATRAISNYGRVDSQRVRTANLEDDDWQKLYNGIGRMNDKPILIDEKSSPTIAEVQRWARKMKQKHGIKILFVDYLQRLSGNNPRDSRIEQVSEIARGLKTLARELNIPVVTLAQVNREVEKRTDKRPLMGDLANSSEIEKEADEIIMLYRDEVYNEDSQDAGIAELNVEKNRHGPTGLIRVAWLAKFIKFENLVYNWGQR